MKFNWRPLETADYPMLQQWWDDWNWPQPPTLDMLPFGVLVYVKETGTPVYAGFLYETGTSIGWLEFVISSKDAKIEDKRGGIEYLVDVIGTIGKYRGLSTIFTSTLAGGFVQSLKRANFVVTDEGMTNLVKRL